MNENLSPHQFLQEHVDFHRWTRSEEERLQKEHEVSPGHSSFPPEAGLKMSRLRGARTFLEDTYSLAAHEAIHTGKPFDHSWVAGSVHEMVDERFHPVVDEYMESRGKQK